MDRLTERDEFGNTDIIGVESTDLQLNLDFEEFNMVTEALNRLADYEDAEDQGRLLRLPCKVGDILYEIDAPEYGVIVCEVRWITIVKNYSVQIEVIKGHGTGSGYCFEPKDFEKSVFLTREQAEAALKEMQNDG